MNNCSKVIIELLYTHSDGARKPNRIKCCMRWKQENENEKL